VNLEDMMMFREEEMQSEGASSSSTVHIDKTKLSGNRIAYKGRSLSVTAMYHE